MENFDNFTKLRFVNCIGFALEQGGSMMKITQKVYEVTADTSIAYIMNEKGKILCTILPNKREYESIENVDRRRANVENKFTVNWDSAGRVCTITHAKRKKKGCLITAIILIVFFLLMMCGIGAFICYKIFHHNHGYEPEIEYPVYVDDTDDIEIEPTDAAMPSESAEETPDGNYTLSAEEIAARSKVYINALQSMDCDLFTVMQVENWFDGLTSREQQYTDIKAYIDAYNRFFNANQYEDIKNLDRNYFSVAQQKVIWEGYGKNAHQFSSWKNDFGMSFTIPYNAGLIN